MAGDDSRPEELVTQLQAELARANARNARLERVLAEAILLLTPEQFSQLRATLDAQDNTGEGGGDGKG
jgi:hypothetical protein